MVLKVTQYIFLICVVGLYIASEIVRLLRPASERDGIFEWIGAFSFIPYYSFLALPFIIPAYFFPRAGKWVYCAAIVVFMVVINRNYLWRVVLWLDLPATEWGWFDSSLGWPIVILAMSVFGVCLEKMRKSDFLASGIGMFMLINYALTPFLMTFYVSTKGFTCTES